MKTADLRCQASAFDPCLFVVFRSQGQAVGVFTAHIDDILGCGEPDVLPKIRGFPEQRFGTMKLQRNSFARVGTELKQGANFSVTLTPASGYFAAIMGGASEAALAGRCETASMQVGRTMLAANCFASGYLR